MDMRGTDDPIICACRDAAGCAISLAQARAHDSHHALYWEHEAKTFDLDNLETYFDIFWK